MKKVIPYVFVSAIIILTIFNFCQEEKIGLNMYAQNLPGQVKIDTVNYVFSLTFAPKSPVCLSSVAANLYFDETAFEYLPDSMKVYGVFATEAVNFWTPNRVSFGFASNVNVCGFNGTKKVFTIAFKVKETLTEPMLKYFELKDVEIYKDGTKIVPHRKDTARLPIWVIQLFMFNWIIRSY